MTAILALLQTLVLACCTGPTPINPSGCWPVGDENDLSECDPDDLTAFCVVDDAGRPIECREVSLTCTEYTGKVRPYVAGQTCEGDVS
jgi:hypothetical protein